MSKFGVCNYDLNSCVPRIDNLVEFETFEEAFDDYIKKFNDRKEFLLMPKNLWIVWIENETIVQFWQLKTNVMCKIIDLKERK